MDPLNFGFAVCSQPPPPPLKTLPYIYIYICVELCFKHYPLKLWEANHLEIATQVVHMYNMSVHWLTPSLPSAGAFQMHQLALHNQCQQDYTSYMMICSTWRQSARRTPNWSCLTLRWFLGKVCYVGKQQVLGFSPQCQWGSWRQSFQRNLLSRS